MRFNQWVLKKGWRRAREEGDIYFDVNGFSKHFSARVETYIRVLIAKNRNPNNFLIIDYNDTFIPKELDKICNFIGGVRYVDVESSHKKILSKNYSKIVVNWEEVNDFMSCLKVDERMSFFEFCKITNELF